MNDSETMIEAGMCALLRGEPAAWPASEPAKFEAQFRDCAAYHGVGPLLARQHSLGRLRDDRIPGFLFPAGQAKDETAIELTRKYALVRALNALAESGVTPLLLKGAALAYSIYPSPALRPRADTDLLIRSVDRAVTDRILSRLGYEKPNAISGDIVKYQCGYVMRDRFGMDHVLDVHWRISNTQLFSRALDYEELRLRSVSLANLGEHARGLALEDALLHACIHRAHHMHSPIWVDGAPRVSGDRLIWLYDMHLMVAAMSKRQLMDFARLARRKGMRAICRDGLLETHKCFGTKIPEDVLVSMAGAGPVEPSEAHLQAGSMRYFLTELRSLPRWPDRIKLLREHLFPPVDYMLEKYALTNHVWLPVLYLKRGIHGAWKRLQSP